MFDKLWLIVEAQDIQEMSTVTLPDQGEDKHTDNAAPRHASHPYPSPTICIPTSPRLESLAQLVTGRLCTAYQVPGISGKLPANCLDRYAVSPNDSSALFTEIICSSLESETSIIDQDLKKIESERKKKMVEMLPYRVEVRYVPGLKMELADHGSRYPISHGLKHNRESWAS